MTKQRMARFRELMAKRGLDAFLATHPASRRYLSGFTPDDGQWGESSGALLITPADAFLLTDFRYELTARGQARLFTTRIYRRSLGREVAQILAGGRVKRLGFEAEGMLVLVRDRLAQELEGVELCPTHGLVSRLRRIKDRKEQETLKASLALLETAVGWLLAQDLAGRTEREVARAYVRRLEDLGAEGEGFPPIVAAGPAGAEPHAEPGSRVIAHGEPVILDLGAKLDGYVADFTRTSCRGVARADRPAGASTRVREPGAPCGPQAGKTGARPSLGRRLIEQAGRQPSATACHGGPVHPRGPLHSPLRGPLEPGMSPGGAGLAPGWGEWRLEQMVLIDRNRPAPSIGWTAR